MTEEKNDLFQIEPYSYCVKIPTVRLLKSSLCWGDRLDTMKVVLLKHSMLVMQDRAFSPSVKIIPNIEQDYLISFQQHKYIMKIMDITSSHLLPL